jgi:ribosomal protein S15
MPPRLIPRPCSQLIDCQYYTIIPAALLLTLLLALSWRSTQTPPSRCRNTLPKTIQSQFTTSSKSQASQRQQREYGDPYALAQARQRKAANLARQAVLKKEREATIGDPVRGITTPFIQSFDTIAAPPSNSTSTEQPLNFKLTQSDVDKALEDIRDFTEPIPSPNKHAADPEIEKMEMEEHQHLHENAQIALSRIMNLANGSNKDRSRVNVQRCIEKFGRHRTDETLPPKPALPSHPSNPTPVEKTPRSGPDTGSPEVQVAILTSKIRVVANHLEGKGRQDKMNKRNLRLLVHRRQKLLKYLRRKERGGPRWQNLIETLGLTDGTWKHEISL